MRRLCVVVALALSVAPAKSFGASVDVRPSVDPLNGYVVWIGDGDSAASLDVARDPAGMRITSAAGPLTVGSGCRAVGSTAATCPFHQIESKLGAGDDRLRLDLPTETGDGGSFAGAEVAGGPGDDWIGGVGGGWHLYGEGGNDHLIVEGGGGGAPAGGATMHGGDGNDELRANTTIGGHFFDGAGDDLIVGSESLDDQLHDGPGADVFHGGGGQRDTVSYADRTTGVSVDLDGEADDGAPGEHDLIDSDVENVTGSLGDDTITGSAERNAIDGLAGDDTLDGGDGIDELRGGYGDDLLEGGGGDDVLFNDEGRFDVPPGEGPGADEFRGGDGIDGVAYASAETPVTASLDGLRNDGRDGENDLIGPDVEEIGGGSAPDHLIGNDQPNVMWGLPGDVVDGLGGDDTFVPPQNFCRDPLDCLPAHFDGGDGIDTIDESASFAPALWLDLSRGGGARAETVSIENVIGSTYGDRIVGDAARNSISSGAGSDAISTRGDGADEVSCGDDRDWVDADPADTVDASCESVDTVGEPPGVALGKGRVRVNRQAAHFYVELSRPGLHLTLRLYVRRRHRLRRWGSTTLDTDWWGRQRVTVPIVSKRLRGLDRQTVLHGRISAIAVDLGGDRTEHTRRVEVLVRPHANEPVPGSDFPQLRR